MENTKCMPTPPKRVGREFVRQYYTIMNKSPENLHCFYSEQASFVHDDVDPAEHRTVMATGKKAIRDVMLDRSPHFAHTSTRIYTVDTIDTLNDGLLVQINGEISFNEQPMRPFSQTIILMPKSPFQYFVQNDIFRFCDFDADAPTSRSDSITSQTMLAQEDWGTQCEDEIESYEETMARHATKPHGNSSESGVKLDSSDSGLSSDAEKAIMDIQSVNLKNMLQESRSITKEMVLKRGPTPPTFNEPEPTNEIETKPADGGDVSENRSQLFRDSCILTIGNVINPNIEFADNKRDDGELTEMERSQEMAEMLNSTAKTDDSHVCRTKHKKRKEKRKSKADISKDKSFGESVESVELHKTPAVKNPPTKHEKPSNTTPSSNNEQTTQSIEKTPAEAPDAKKSVTSEPETPKAAPEVKTYADLAKAGKAEWVDELAPRRESIDRTKQRPMIVRRSSRSEKTTPPKAEGNRTSPKNDLLQVFIGNIPHTASEDGIRKMFSRFGRMTRFRLHTNTRKDWLPRYAFITYENINSVKQCLMKKATFFWPENSPDGQKLNVNGDPSVDVFDDAGNRRSNEIRNQTREFRQFSRNFVLEGRDQNEKRSPDSDTNISDSVKGERRKGSTRA